MSRKRKRNSPLRVIVLLALVAGAIYVNQVIVPVTPPLFVATPTPTRAPGSYVKDAEALIASGKINKAIEAYQAAVKADPENPTIYVTLARWQVLNGDLAGAKENVQNALLIDPNYVLAHAVDGWIMGQQGDYLQAESELNDVALQQDPKNALAWAYLTEVYVDELENSQGDLNTQQKAISASQNAVKFDSSLMETHRARGLVFEITTQHAEAIAEYEAAVQINPNLAELYVALGREYRLVDNYSQAVEVLMKAISLRPDDPDPYAELASTYLKAGDFSKGIQIAEQAVAKKPQDGFLQGLLGTMYYKSERYTESVAPLRLAVRGGVTADGTKVEPVALDSQDASSVAYYSRFGIALAYIGQCNESLQVAQELSQKIPDDENVAANAQLMIDTCKAQASGKATPMGGTATPESVATPEATTAATPAATGAAETPVSNP